MSRIPRSLVNRAVLVVSKIKIKSLVNLSGYGRGPHPLSRAPLETLGDGRTPVPGSTTSVLDAGLVAGESARGYLRTHVRRLYKPTDMCILPHQLTILGLVSQLFFTISSSNI